MTVSPPPLPSFQQCADYVYVGGFSDYTKQFYIIFQFQMTAGLRFWRFWIFDMVIEDLEAGKYQNVFMFYYFQLFSVQLRCIQLFAIASHCFHLISMLFHQYQFLFIVILLFSIDSIVFHWFQLISVDVH